MPVLDTLCHFWHARCGRDLIYLGSARKDFQKLPEDVRDTFLFAFDIALDGRVPANAKILQGFGGGSVLEVIDDYRTDTFRAVYTVRFEEAVYVLHVFKKKSRKGSELPRPDRTLIERRLAQARQIEQERTRK